MAGFAKVFKTSVRRNVGVDSDTTGDAAPTTAPALVTVQSLATFPGAALAITIVWKFFDHALNIESRAVPIVAAFAVGIALYWLAITSNMTRRDKIIGAGIGAVNAMYLALSVLGIDIGLEEAGVTGQTGPDAPADTGSETPADTGTEEQP